MGLKGDLTAGEIVEQLVHAQGVTRIKNVVFMARAQALLPPVLAAAPVRQVSASAGELSSAHHRRCSRCVPGSRNTSAAGSSLHRSALRAWQRWFGLAEEIAPGFRAWASR